MAITLVQRKKIQQGLVLALIAVLLVTTTVLWFGFFKKEEAIPVGETLTPALQPVEIDFGVLKLPLLETLDNPLQAALEPETPGRKNPFLPF
jgi:hypothetical protein